MQAWGSKRGVSLSLLVEVASEALTATRDARQRRLHARAYELLRANVIPPVSQPPPSLGASCASWLFLRLPCRPIDIEAAEIDRPQGCSVQMLLIIHSLLHSVLVWQSPVIFHMPSSPRAPLFRRRAPSAPRTASEGAVMSVTGLGRTMSTI